MNAETWATRYGVAFRYRHDGKHWDADGWEHNRYRVRLVANGARVGFAWRQGLGIDHPPTLADVLPALVSDAEAGAQTFDGFAADFGSDPDSLSAYRTWKACKRARARLHGFADELGRDAWDELLTVREDDEP